MNNPPCLSVRDVTSLARIGRTTVFAEIRAGRLAAKKIGARTIILRSDFDRWLDGLPSKPATGEAAP